MTVFRETSIEAFNMQGRHVHPVASLQSLNLSLWATELLHSNSCAQSLCGIFYWFIFPRFFSVFLLHRPVFCLYSVLDSQSDVAWPNRFIPGQALLNFLRRTFSIDFFLALLKQDDVHICLLPQSQPTRSVTFPSRCFSAAWLCLEILRNRHTKRREDWRQETLTLSRQTGLSNVASETWKWKQSYVIISADRYAFCWSLTVHQSVWKLVTHIRMWQTRNGKNSLLCKFSGNLARDLLVLFWFL